MSEEEVIKWLKETINYYKKDIEDNGKEFLREETLEKYETLLNIIEKKDKIIDLMAEEMNNNYDFDEMCANCGNDACLDGKADYGKECVKEYFKNKVKEN